MCLILYLAIFLISSSFSYKQEHLFEMCSKNTADLYASLGLSLKYMKRKWKLQEGSGSGLKYTKSQIWPWEWNSPPLYKARSVCCLFWFTDTPSQSVVQRTSLNLKNKTTLYNKTSRHWVNMQKKPLWLWYLTPLVKRVNLRDLRKCFICTKYVYLIHTYSTCKVKC